MVDQAALREALQRQLSAYDLTVNIVIGAVVGVITATIILVFALRKLKAKVMPDTDEEGVGRRFRKRDKVMFYGRKMLRKVRSFTNNALVSRVNGRKIKRRQSFAKLARQLLSRHDSIPQLNVDNLPESFLEPEEFPGADQYRLPPDIMYMLRSVRVFGHLEKPLFLELCRHVESNFVPAGSMLFKVGDLDDSIYVVQAGRSQVDAIMFQKLRKNKFAIKQIAFRDLILGYPPVMMQFTADLNHFSQRRYLIFNIPPHFDI